uniref:Tc1-like transposase DDE domain-containing protein n=1 Tax=Salarias fasciatus TaxID=181472 RepID=A0A672I933_SALFA
NGCPVASVMVRAKISCRWSTVLPWPAYSPHMNPTERLWDYLGRQVTSQVPQPANRQQLIQALQVLWTGIPQDFIQHQQHAPMGRRPKLANSPLFPSQTVTVLCCGVQLTGPC